MEKLRKRMAVYYSGMQFEYWAVYCLLISFTTVYLQANNYSSSEIGIIMSVSNIVALFVQPAVAAWVDRSSKINAVSIIKILVSVIGLLEILQLFMNERCLLMTFTYSVAFCAQVMCQPFITSAVFVAEKNGIKISFSAGRAIGSLAYAIAAAVMGTVVEKLGVTVLPVIVATLAAVMLITVILFNKGCGKGVEVKSEKVKKDSSSTIDFFRKNKRFAVLLIGITLLFFDHTLVSNFTILIVQNLNGTSADMGTICGFWAGLEVPVMFIIDRIMKKWKCTSLLRFALVMFSAKALGFLLAPSVPWLYLAAFLQAPSFAIYTPCAVRYAFMTVDRQDEVKAQSFLLLASTVASIFSSFTGGILFDSIGVKSTLLVAFIVSVIGSVIAFLAVDIKVGNREENA